MVRLVRLTLLRVSLKMFCMQTPQRADAMVETRPKEGCRNSHLTERGEGSKALQIAAGRLSRVLFETREGGSVLCSLRLTGYEYLVFG